MRTKKSSTGRTFVYRRSPNETSSEALLREFKSLKNSYKSNSKYFDYNYWRYSDAKKHFFSSCKRLSEILEFMSLDDPEVKEILGDGILKFLGCPSSLNELVKIYPEGYKITLVNNFSNKSSGELYKLIDLSIKIIVNPTTMSPMLECTESVYYTNNSKGYDISNRYEFSEDGFSRLLKSIERYTTD